MLQVRRVADLDAFHALAPAWNALVDRRDPASIFWSHAWVGPWFDAFGAGRTPAVLVATLEDRLVGVLPLCASRRRIGVRRLDLMANGHSPCADLIAEPGLHAPVRQAFARHLRDTWTEWDEAQLPELRADSHLARCLDLHPDIRCGVQPQRRAPYIVLDGDWDGFRTSLSKNFQKVLRNNRNRVARQGGAEIECIEAQADLPAALDEAMALGEHSWQGHEGSGIGSTPENARFYRGMVAELGARGLVRLWFLRLGGQRVAFELHVVHGDVEFGLKTGYRSDLEEVGIGTYLDQHIVQQLFAEKRCREYDLLGDFDFYKRRWTEQARDYVRVTAFGQRLGARALSHWNLELRPRLRQQARLLRLRAGVAAAAVGAEAFVDRLTTGRWP
jgi:CelD/BcsL family acetyltransferase involved in cellulose biosynthesis